jgi:hypothetical protein
VSLTVIPDLWPNAIKAACAAILGVNRSEGAMPGIEISCSSVFPITFPVTLIVLFILHPFILLVFPNNCINYTTLQSGCQVAFLAQEKTRPRDREALYVKPPGRGYARGA